MSFLSPAEIVYKMSESDLMEKNEIPLATAILGIVLGKIIEDNFMVSMIKAQGNLLMFFERQYSLVLGVITLLLWCFLLTRMVVEISSGRRQKKK